MSEYKIIRVKICDKCGNEMLPDGDGCVCVCCVANGLQERVTELESENQEYRERRKHCEQLEAENKELRERIAELEKHNDNFHEGLKEAMKPENWQQ